MSIQFEQCECASRSRADHRDSVGLDAVCPLRSLSNGARSTNAPKRHR